MSAHVCRTLAFVLGIMAMFPALPRHTLAANPQLPTEGSGISTQAGIRLLEDKSATDKLAPYTATRFGPMAIYRFDMMQRMLFHKVNPSISNKKAANFASEATGLVQRPQYLTSPTEPTGVSLPDATAYTRDWTFWLANMSLPERYDAKSPYFKDVTGSSTGYSLGAFRKFEDFSLGMTGFYLLSSLSGDGWSSVAENFGFMGGVRSKPLELGLIKPWLEAGIGYTYIQALQDRKDYFGNAHESAPCQNSLRLSAKGGQPFNLLSFVRLTPILGLDYTYAHQGKYSEDGTNPRLTVYSARMHSARSRTGGEMEMKLLEGLSITSHAFFHYELGERNASLDASVEQTDIRFRTQGENYNRKSGNGSVGLSWKPIEDFSLKAQYDVTVGYHQPYYEMQAILEWTF